jgi:hypothetical protein
MTIADEQPAVLDEMEKFYVAHPGYKDRQPCVVRVFTSLPSPTWRELLSAAHTACFPGPTWVYVADGEDGRSTYIDSSRIEVRREHQVRFWVMTEVFDSKHDFFVSHMVADCDARKEGLLYTAWLVAGRYEDGGTPPLEWESDLPEGSVAAALLGAACR